MYENIDSPQTLEMMKMWQWGLTRHSWQPGQCGCHGDVIISLDVYVRHWCQTLSGGPPGHQAPARCLSLTSKCPSFYWVLSTYYLLLFGLGHDQRGVAPSLCYRWSVALIGVRLVLAISAGHTANVNHQTDQNLIIYLSNKDTQTRFCNIKSLLSGLGWSWDTDCFDYFLYHRLRQRNGRKYKCIHT